MIGEVMAAISNYFPFELDGASEISADGTIAVRSSGLGYAPGMYVRIGLSRFNDGVYKVKTVNGSTITVETEDGLPMIHETGIQIVLGLLAPPREFLRVVAEIEAFRSSSTGKAEGVASESFDGYSYQKQAGAGGDTSWKSVFAARLSTWRKFPEPTPIAWVEALRRELWLKGVYR